MFLPLKNPCGTKSTWRAVMLGPPRRERASGREVWGWRDGRKAPALAEHVAPGLRERAPRLPHWRAAP